MRKRRLRISYHCLQNKKGVGVRGQRQMGSIDNGPFHWIAANGESAIYTFGNKKVVGLENYGSAKVM